MRLIKENIIILVFFQLLITSCELDKGKKLFTLLTPSQSGLFITGEVRQVRKITLKNELVFARNNDELKIMKWG